MQVRPTVFTRAGGGSRQTLLKFCLLLLCLHTTGGNRQNLLKLYLLLS